METVQLTISDARYAVALREMLERNGTRTVTFAEVPDSRRDGVIVIDSEALDRLPSPILNPERIVLITRNDPHRLSQAWNAGIRSVVFSEDPLSTAVLAIMAAELRHPKTEPRLSAPHAHGPAGPGACEHASEHIPPVVRTGAGSLQHHPGERRSEFHAQRKEGLK